MPKRTYTIECVDCHGDITTTLPPSKRKGGLTCGRGECRDAHNARAAQHADEVTARRSAAARQAKPRTPTALYGDYAQLAALHGITTDGTGRRN